MKTFILKHKVAMTFLVMLLMTSMGVMLIMLLKGYEAMGAIATLWFIPIILGIAFCVISVIALLVSQQERQQWKKSMLIGLWFLLVSGGSCGMLWGLVYAASSR